ncbi:hypothetical protein KKG77_01380 [bacterium]|nr:hypothetical protein [bacterium]
MNSLNILKVLGIPDDNNVKVLYNDGFFKQFSLFFDGNSSFLENVEIPNSSMTTLYLGGEKQTLKVELQTKPDVIVNMICDPEIHKNSLTVFDKLNFKATVLNKPKDIFKTKRDELSQNLSSTEQFVIPKTYRIKPNSKEDILSSANKFFGGKSFLMRSVSSHGGVDLIKIDDYDKVEFSEYALNGEKEYFITEYIDFKSDDNLYRKIRFFVLDGIVLPRHQIVSDSWKIHSNTRLKMMDKKIYMKEEKDFLENVPKVFYDFCTYIYNYLKLDFFGIDCAILPNGQIVLFEANVCMRPFSNHEKEYLQKINSDLMNDFIKFLNKKASSHV